VSKCTWTRQEPVEFRLASRSCLHGLGTWLISVVASISEKIDRSSAGSGGISGLAPAYCSDVVAKGVGCRHMLQLSVAEHPSIHITAVTCFSYRWQSIHASTSLPSHASAIGGRASKRPHHYHHMLQLSVAEHPRIHITTVTCFSYRLASKCQWRGSGLASDEHPVRSNRTAIGGRAAQDPGVSAAWHLHIAQTW